MTGLVDLDESNYRARVAEQVAEGILNSNIDSFESILIRRKKLQKDDSSLVESDQDLNGQRRSKTQQGMRYRDSMAILVDEAMKRNGYKRS